MTKEWFIIREFVTKSEAEELREALIRDERFPKKRIRIIGRGSWGGWLLESNWTDRLDERFHIRRAMAYVDGYMRHKHGWPKRTPVYAVYDEATKFTRDDFEMLRRERAQGRLR